MGPPFGSHVVGLFVWEQGEPDMHQIVVASLCRFGPLSPKGDWPFAGTGKTLFSLLIMYFYGISRMNPLSSSHQEKMRKR